MPKVLAILNGPEQAELDSMVEHDDRSRHTSFLTEEGWHTVYCRSIEINNAMYEKGIDIVISNDNYKVEYDSAKHTGTLEILEKN
ncbi:MAG TPA: hypothetical protein VLB02_00260 [Candidatus Paceibacterota bacterium]|nr:hypothetical protein [Candidatus Paceibacterota bacterium]